MDNFIKSMDLHEKYGLTRKRVWVPIAISVLPSLYTLFMKKKYMTWKERCLTFGCIGYMVWLMHYFGSQVKSFAISGFI